MFIKCKLCGNEIDPNDEQTEWAPPVDTENSLGSIVCPNPQCTNRADFSEWTAITSPAKSGPPA